MSTGDHARPPRSDEFELRGVPSESVDTGPTGTAGQSEKRSQLHQHRRLVAIRTCHPWPPLVLGPLDLGPLGECKTTNLGRRPATGRNLRARRYTPHLGRWSERQRFPTRPAPATRSHSNVPFLSSFLLFSALRTQLPKPIFRWRKRHRLPDLSHGGTASGTLTVVSGIACLCYIKTSWKDKGNTNYSVYGKQEGRWCVGSDQPRLV